MDGTPEIALHKPLEEEELQTSAQSHQCSWGAYWRVASGGAVCSRLHPLALVDLVPAGNHESQTRGRPLVHGMAIAVG